MTRSVAITGIATLAALAAGGGVSYAAPRHDTACAVPARYATIQSAVNTTACTAIKVAPGTYAENVTIGRSLKLHGARSGQDARTRRGGGESVINGGALATITIDADNVTVDGFTLNGPPSPGTAALVMQTGKSGETIQNNVINNPGRAASITTSRSTFTRNLVKNTPTANDGFQTNSMPVRDVTISDNTFTGPTPSTYNADVTFIEGDRNLTVSGNRSTGTGTLVAFFKTTGGRVTGNTVAGKPDSSAVYIGGANSNITVSGNTISGAGSAIRVVNRPNSGVTITRNTLRKNQYGVNVGPGAVSGTLAVNRNSIAGNTAYGVFNDPTSGGPVNATCNWWGSLTGPGPVGPGRGDKVSTAVTYRPWLKLSSLITGCQEARR
ncbi:right-handed parallel beta-helix repeat-containing protein [Actinoplanes sp. Pm04-4]|uniref:Right-handed parallel beta-helix repeat-containing protein n=1 Tax=Paractinoplanes pyxinae TaxID=2997416 RepID=A0ABT4B079_9ACTN|nr:right-handed parallel beta-helix repeat-containing protein [Actinoplanes pyxinae]MCY1139894.1 right-handed parallel beta-helix repeat-containing protein [Actinoplanes pyxinae]